MRYFLLSCRPSLDIDPDSYMTMAEGNRAIKQRGSSVFFTESPPSSPAIRRSSVNSVQRNQNGLAQSETTRSSKASRDLSKKIRPSTAIKVEPKTFFANERTFIQWVSAAVLIFSLGVALFGMGSTSDSWATRVVGTVMIPFALFIVVYGYIIFHVRAKNIRNKYTHTHTLSLSLLLTHTHTLSLYLSLFMHSSS